MCRAGVGQCVSARHPLPLARSQAQEARGTHPTVAIALCSRADLSRTTRRYVDAENERDAARHGRPVLDEGLRIIAPETGEDVTRFHIDGARYALEIAEIIGARRAYLKGGSPSCDRQGVTGEVLTRGGIKVIRIG